ncbi:hypothetical protein NW768_006512 [Fusarium equiseti]|uniref:Uncharacterized protein n=1 Tax=Fusarium equiseti TaxID=61235 RepID=A0ABQ8RBQ2_FUSEQ|nr:hypothetical protein NW768_006512 [Fusarium equiseti]
MAADLRIPVWTRVAIETGELLFRPSDSKSVPARHIHTFTGYNRGPVKDVQEPMRQYDFEDHLKLYAGTPCILVETLIKDIPNTEYSVYLFNHVDVPDKSMVKMTNLPHWTDEDGMQNIFFPHHLPAEQPVNHYHAVVGSGIPKPNTAQTGSTTVNLRVGPGGTQRFWYSDKGIYGSLKKFKEANWSVRVAYGTATCIKFKFDVSGRANRRLIFRDHENIVTGQELEDVNWHDSMRVIIGQPNHPFKISINFRFVETQNSNPEEESKTDVEVFSMHSVRLDREPVISSVKGRTVTTYTCRIGLSRN